jgi:hypothetical protein
MRAELRDPLYLSSSLIGIAALALHDGDPAGAVRWLGAVDSVLDRMGAAVQVVMRFLYDRTQESAKQLLGESAFNSAWNEGSKWSQEEAVTRALD